MQRRHTRPRLRPPAAMVRHGTPKLRRRPVTSSIACGLQTSARSPPRPTLRRLACRMLLTDGANGRVDGLLGSPTIVARMDRGMIVMAEPADTQGEILGNPAAARWMPGRMEYPRSPPHFGSIPVFRGGGSETRFVCTVRAKYKLWLVVAQSGQSIRNGLLRTPCAWSWRPAAISGICATLRAT